MRPYLSILTILCLWPGYVQAQGLLVPEDKNLQPLALIKYQVAIAIDDQVATVNVEQVFQNTTERQLEATYVFPVPKGASVNQFAMWVDGKKMTGELLRSDQARQTYTDIVRRTQDPGLLEYLDNNLMRLRVFPIAPRSEQKIALSFTSMATLEGGAVSYVYPLKGDSKGALPLKNFALTATIKSQQGVQNVYSPSHPISFHRVSEKEVTVGFEQGQARLDQDFQIFYAPGNKDVEDASAPATVEPTITPEQFAATESCQALKFAESNARPPARTFLSYDYFYTDQSKPSPTPSAVSALATGKSSNVASDKALQTKRLYDEVRQALQRGDRSGYQSGKVGVDLSVAMNTLRTQSQVEAPNVRRVAGRVCLEVGGIWIDETYDAKLPKLVVKAMSAAYFRILERHPSVKDVFQLGNTLVWVTPSGTALMIIEGDGREDLSDAEIDGLFVAK